MEIPIINAVSAIVKMQITNLAQTFISMFVQTGATVNFDEEVQNGHQESMGARKKCSNPLVQIIRNKFQKKPPEIECQENPPNIVLTPTRYKPDSLEGMIQKTKFSKEEIKFMYRTFKQECPSGIVDEEHFAEVYNMIFPLGDSRAYAHLVFSTIDRHDSGTITFGDFMEFLSVITNGSTHDKLEWSFRFYDRNKDGEIDRDEMVQVTESIFELMGKAVEDLSGKDHGDHVFDTMDTNGDGVVTLQEFLDYCNTCHSVTDNLLVLP